MKAEKYERLDASEYNFKKLELSAPAIIHISTHGLLFSGNKQSTLNKKMLISEIISLNNNTSLSSHINSGLAFSGANKLLKKQSDTSQANTEDGILFDYEISNLELYNTKLVVLSACQTGLGKITNTEGVFGLQRAFKLAGVQSVIVALWKIEDQAAYLFMKTLYKNFIKLKNIKAAFKETQNYMKKLYPNKPYYWGAFIIV